MADRPIYDKGTEVAETALDEAQLILVAAAKEFARRNGLTDEDSAKLIQAILNVAAEQKEKNVETLRWDVLGEGKTGPKQ